MSQSILEWNFILTRARACVKIEHKTFTIWGQKNIMMNVEGNNPN